MKKRVWSTAIAAATLLTSLSALADSSLAGPKCRDWEQFPNLAAQQWIIGYANAWEYARQAQNNDFRGVDRLRDVRDVDIFDAVSKACKELGATDITDIMDFAARYYERAGERRTKELDARDAKIKKANEAMVEEYRRKQAAQSR